MSTETTSIRVYRETVAQQEKSDFAFLNSIRLDMSKDLPRTMPWQDFTAQFIRNYQDMAAFAYDCVYSPNGAIQSENIKAKALELLYRTSIDGDDT